MTNIPDSSGPLPPPVIGASAPGAGSAAAPVRMVLLNADGLIDEDIACRGCGYNLRGLSPHGRCPECEIAIGRSIQGDLLQFCEPGWVDRLARGMKWLIGGVIATVAGVIFGIAFAVVLLIYSGALSGGGGGATPTAATMSNMALVGVAQAGVQLVVASVFMVGFWLLTSPDPADPSEAPPVNVRTVARYVLLAWLISSPLMALMSQSYTSTAFSTAPAGGAPAGPATFLNSTALTVLTLVAALASVAAVVGYVALFIHVRRLARRVPDAGLASHTTIVMWGLVSAMILEAAVAIIAAFAINTMLGSLVTTGAGQTRSTGAIVAMILMGIGGCAIGALRLVFGIWAVVLMVRYLGAFKNAAAKARAIWSPVVVTPPSRPSPGLA
jgi:hypothetical protein